MDVNQNSSSAEKLESTVDEQDISKIEWKRNKPFCTLYILLNRRVVEFIHSTTFILCIETSLGIRHLHVFLLFTCIAVSYCMRVNLSVAIVVMIDKKSANPEYDEFQWNEQTQSLLLSSFFWGYIITQIPAGQIAEKFGPKFILLISISICAIATIITPICTSVGGWEAMCALLVILGLCQGVVYPSAHTLLSKWAPPSERGPLGTYAYVGAEFGAVVMLGISGVLASSLMGWPSIFYFSGAVSLLWAVIWFWLGSNAPNERSWISESEKKYIELSLKTTTDDNNEKVKRKPPTPWFAMATSTAFLALTLTQAAQMWGYWTMLTKMPAYMKNILKFDLKENALFSALPYLAKLLLSLVFSVLAQFLDRRKFFSLEFSRKFFNSIGQWIPALIIIGLSYVSSNHAELAVALLTLAIGINAAPYLGFQIGSVLQMKFFRRGTLIEPCGVNHIDLAPNFAGTMMGM